MESFKFNTIVQKEKQPFSEFETELRKQIKYCEFMCNCGSSYQDRLLRDRIIIGVHDKRLQLKLLDGHNETLASVIEKCKTFEAAYVNKMYLDRNATTSNVCSVDQAAKETSTTVAAIARKCYNCGGPFTPTHLRVCKANGVTCNACGRVGHFSQWCKQQDKKDGQPHGNKTGQQQSHKEGQHQKVNKENKCLSINWNNE
ncbi:hypothetical protein ACLKA6_017656 [Drosophila palustris]